ncbi:MAG: hypothetical protein ABII97_00610 [Patescibacteria group bacterium]
MTRKCVTDDEYGKLKRRLEEVSRRIDEGTIPFERTMAALQIVIEGKFGQHLANIDPEYFWVEVDYGLSFNEMMVKIGPFTVMRGDYINEKNFPIYGEGISRACIELMSFREESLNLEQMLARFTVLNYRPAKIEELFSFAAKYPFAQENLSIVALHRVVSTEHSFSFAPRLSRSGHERAIDIITFDDKNKTAERYHIGTRFAAVKIRD